MGKIPVGIQLYSVRDDCAKDLPGTLKAIAAMGYDGVEFAGYHGRTASELKTMLDDLGLKCCGTHIGLNTFLGDELKKTVEFNKALNNPYLIVPWLGEEYTKSRETWLKTAGVFNEIADKLKSDNMVIGYHNHNTEFTPKDGELPWDTFFGNTKPEVVMQFDTGNAMDGGSDAIPFLKRYPGRAKTVHLKEYKKGEGYSMMGEGDMPWKDILELCETIGGTKWYIVEQEVYNLPPMECISICLKFLRSLGR